MNSIIFACGNLKEGCLGKNFVEENCSSNTPYQKIQFSFPQSPTNTSIKEIYCGDFTTFFLLENGQVYACGDDNHMQLGVDNKAKEIYEPELVQILNDKIIEVAPGASRTWFIGESGNIYLAGINLDDNLLKFENYKSSKTKIRIISPTTQQPYLRQGEIIKHIYSFGDNIIITKYNNLYHLYTINDNNDNNNPLQLEFSFPFQIKKFFMVHSFGSNDYAILFEENNLCLLKEDITLYLIENVIDISVGYGHTLFCIKYFCKEDNCFKQKLYGCGTNLDGQVCPKNSMATDNLFSSMYENNLNLTNILQDKIYLVEKALNNSKCSHNQLTVTFLKQFTLHSNNFRFNYVVDFSDFLEFEGTDLANEWIENIVSISCGGWHSGFVTKYGQVFGFGFNENYQIGTDKIDDTRGVYETVFFQDELMKYGNEYIPQIRCGNRSTIVFLKKIGKGRENHFLFLQKITKNNELCDVDIFISCD
ncbi:hypothetical protein ABK040_013592 [Willaertia magna]